MLTSVTSKTHLNFSDRVGTALLPVDDFIEKPVKPAEILARIEAMLAKTQDPDTLLTGPIPILLAPPPALSFGGAGATGR